VRRPSSCISIAIFYVLSQMTLHVQAICRNTFLSFVVDAAGAAVEDLVPTSLRCSRRLPPRSKSAETIRNRPEAETAQELVQPSLHKLNAVLSTGISSNPAPQAPSQELALHAPPKDLWDKNRRVASNCSLSTMAPDDVSECGELPNMKRMPKVSSSGSVNTLWSDMDSIIDNDEVEFELIEKPIEGVASGPILHQETNATKPEPGVSSAANNNRGKVSSEMSHSEVPRCQNLEGVYKAGGDEPITTLMIRNIPGRYSQKDLMLDLQDTGLAGTYDFLYMPMDKATSNSVGYAFVNFNNSSHAAKCRQMFQDYHFSRHHRTSKKLAIISVAHLQGLEKNMQHYEKSAINMSKEKRRRPVVVPNISQMLVF